MAVYRLTFDFSLNNPELNQSVVIIGSGSFVYFRYTFVAQRTAPNQCTLGSNPYITMQNLYMALQSDYNLTGLLNIYVLNNTLNIESGNYFNNGTPYVYNNSALLTINISQLPNNLELSYEITDPECEEFCLRITSNNQIKYIKYTSIYLQNGFQEFDLSLDPQLTHDADLFYPRLLSTYTIVIEAIDIYDNNKNITVNAHTIMNSSLFELEFTNTISGSNLSIYNSTFGLNLQYSLDGENWQNYPYFNNLLNGDYTLWLKDQFDCIIYIDFTVSQSYVNSPYIHISKSNSIRFKQLIDWGNCSNYKNSENTLSCEGLQLLNYQEKQLFQSCDIITTQFKSNYRDISVKIGENTIPITQISNNLGQKQKLDAKIVQLENGIGIYFLSGNVYNYDTEEIIEEHTLNGELPLWAEIGNPILINDIFYTIDTISFNENLGVWQIELYINSLGTDAVVGSIYNLENYEVFEFEIDFSNYLAETIQVEIINQDDNFHEVRHLSELIEIKEIHDRTLCIEYWNDENTDIIVGIWRHKMRIPFISITAKTDNEVDSFKTDTNVEVYDAKNYEIDVFKFLPVTTEIMRKLILALSHKNVLINDFPYVKNEIESSVLSDFSNLYNVVATMFKAESGVTIGISEVSARTVQLPNLLEGEDGFIAYQ